MEIIEIIGDKKEKMKVTDIVTSILGKPLGTAKFIQE